MRMNSFASWALVSLGVLAVTAIAIWVSRQPVWMVVLLLLFPLRPQPKAIDTRCPRCRHSFTAVEEPDEYDDDEAAL